MSKIEPSPVVGITGGMNGGSMWVDTVVLANGRVFYSKEGGDWEEQKPVPGTPEAVAIENEPGILGKLAAVLRRFA